MMRNSRPVDWFFEFAAGIQTPILQIGVRRSEIPASLVHRRFLFGSVPGGGFQNRSRLVRNYSPAVRSDTSRAALAAPAWSPGGKFLVAAKYRPDLKPAADAGALFLVPLARWR